jgi:probable phosphoglycerate mutase
VKEPTLRDLHARAKQLISKLDWFEIEHVLRGHNREADQLANEAMDKGAWRQTTRDVPPQLARQEFNGIVKDGKIELVDGSIPEGTAVQVRIRR